MKRSETDFFKENMECWNDRVPIHKKSDFYDLDGFIKGTSSLTEIEQEYLGNVFGKRILHLQCHFGMDTLSLSRAGAFCTGIDFSKTAIEEARKLNTLIQQNAEFYECNVYDVLKLNLGQFDIVFTTFGTIGWLPDLDLWAEIISHSLNNGGQFYFCDFHPALYMFDFNTHKLAYSYFNSGVPYSEEEDSTYADRNYQMNSVSHFWSHSLDEIISSLLRHGLQIQLFKEFDYSPYNCFPNMRSIGLNKFRYGSDEVKIPHVYLIKAIKGK